MINRNGHCASGLYIIYLNKLHHQYENVSYQIIQTVVTMICDNGTLPSDQSWLEWSESDKEAQSSSPTIPSTTQNKRHRETAIEQKLYSCGVK